MVVGCTENRGHWRITVFWVRSTGKRTLFLDGECGRQSFAPYLQAGVLGQAGEAVYAVKNVVINKFPHHAQSFAHYVTTPVLRSSFAIALLLTMNARRFQRTHPFGGVSTRKKEIVLGVTGLAQILNQLQQLTQSIRQWLAQLALQYLKVAVIARTDLLTLFLCFGHRA